MGNDPEVLAIACALARYMSANPLASDTPDGIYRWWLGPDHGSMPKLLQALDWMKARGLMEEQVALDGRTRYRRTASDEQLDEAIREAGLARGANH